MKRRRWRWALLLLALLAAPCLPWPLPRAELIGQRPALAPPPGAPRLLVPRRDGDNPLRAVFVARSGEDWEVTLWFSDEDHPWPPLDHAYDLYRYLRWGRVDDLETFRLTRDGALDLRGVFAGPQEFGVLWATHHSTVVLRETPPPLYVRTWNHLLSCEPEPGQDYVVSQAPWLAGSRAELEAAARR